MKVFLALTVIIGGVLISKNLYADYTSVTANKNLKVVPSVAGNVVDCPYAKKAEGPLNFAAVPNDNGRPNTTKPAASTN